MNAQPQRTSLEPLCNRLFHALPAELQALLTPHLRVESLSRDKVCFTTAEAVTQVYFPLTGVISLMTGTWDGHFVRTAMVGREGAVGLQSALSGRQSLTRAVVQTDGSFWTISARRLQELSRLAPAITEWVISYSEMLWAEAHQLAMCNALHEASPRLSRCLLQSSDRLETDKLPFTQEMLAEMLGVRRTTVTLIAHAWQKSGLIKYSRGKIVLLDRAALEKQACECHHVLKLNGVHKATGVPHAQQVAALTEHTSAGPVRRFVAEPV